MQGTARLIVAIRSQCVHGSVGSTAAILSHRHSSEYDCSAGSRISWLTTTAAAITTKTTIATCRVIASAALLDISCVFVVVHVGFRVGRRRWPTGVLFVIAKSHRRNSSLGGSTPCFFSRAVSAALLSEAASTEHIQTVRHARGNLASKFCMRVRFDIT